MSSNSYPYIQVTLVIKFDVVTAAHFAPYIVLSILAVAMTDVACSVQVNIAGAAPTVGVISLAVVAVDINNGVVVCCCLKYC